MQFINVVSFCQPRSYSHILAITLKCNLFYSLRFDHFISSGTISVQAIWPVKMELERNACLNLVTVIVTFSNADDLIGDVIENIGTQLFK